LKIETGLKKNKCCVLRRQTVIFTPDSRFVMSRRESEVHCLEDAAKSRQSYSLVERLLD